MCAPSPPAAPDYQAAAQAQGDVNLKAAKNASPNVISPYGTQTYYEKGSDPASYQRTLEQTIADSQKAILPWQGGDQSWRTQFNTGPYGSERAAQYFDSTNAATQKKIAQAQQDLETFKKTGLVPGDPSRPTVVQKLSPEQQALYDQQVKTQGLLGGLGEQGAKSLQGIVGTSVDFSGAPQTGNYDDTRKKVIDAYMGRANEDYAKQSDTARSNLIAAGIRPGTKAYADNQQMIERSKNDAYQQAEIQGGNAASQAYTMDADRRRQAISEQLAQRQTPLNEINALLSGSQVSNPFAIPTAQGQVPQAAPLFAAQNAAGQYGTDVYNQQAAQAGNLQSGLFGLGGSALMGMAMSDRRTKRNVHRIGMHALGIGIYSFRYRKRQWGNGHFVGVMADEVLKVRPEAVVRLPNGYLAVDYGRLD